MINAFTPSAISSVLLCAATDIDHDYASIYAALRRHLSTSHTDRHYSEGHTFYDETFDRLRSESSSVSDTPHQHNVANRIAAFTIPYFKVTDDEPAADCAPLSPSGRFSIDTKIGKYIREEKFSLSWSSGDDPKEPSLLLVLSPLIQHYVDEEYRSSLVYWVRDNLFEIECKWEEVLDSLDEQTTLSVGCSGFIMLFAFLIWLWLTRN